MALSHDFQPDCILRSRRHQGFRLPSSMATKAFIVTDPVLLETGTAEKVTKVLDEAGLPYEVFSNVTNPPVRVVKDGVAKFAESAPTS